MNNSYLLIKGQVLRVLLKNQKKESIHYKIQFQIDGGVNQGLKIIEVKTKIAKDISEGTLVEIPIVVTVYENRAYYTAVGDIKIISKA